MQDFGILGEPPLGELTMSRNEREEKKMPSIVATYVSAFSPRAAHALRSDQLFQMQLTILKLCCYIDHSDQFCCPEYDGGTGAASNTLGQSTHSALTKTRYCCPS